MIFCVNGEKKNIIFMLLNFRFEGKKFLKLKNYY
jgi:hypothetical protein